MSGDQGSSVDRVHGAIRERILSGEYRPGSRLILSRLADDHGVSFIPVREALRRLEAEKLVKVERNRGARVAELSLADMRDIYETRLVLEEHALRAAIALHAGGPFEDAGRALKAMAEQFEEGDERAAYASHERFHLSLYESSGSMWTVHLVEQLWSSAERYVRLAASVRPDPKLFVAEHEEIFAAVEARDADRAAQKLAENLRTTQRLLAETYEPGTPG